MKKYSGLFWLATFLVVLWVLMRRPEVVAGTELGYPLPPGASTELDDVVRGRLAALGFADGEVERQGDLLLVRIPSEKAEDVADVKRLLRRQGRLELRPSADAAIQTKFKEDGAVPEGFDAVEHRRDDPEYAAWSPRLLLERRSAVEGGRIVRAAAASVPRPDGGREWSVSFGLDAEGARRFDATAAELHARRPPGMLGILLDGRLVMAPVMATTEFGGQGRIANLGGEQEAKDLAVVLASGALPVPLDPEPRFERPFQKSK